MFCFNSFGQNTRQRIDSLISYLESEHVEIEDYVKCEKICFEIDSLSKKIDFTNGVFTANLFASQLYRDFSIEKTQSFLSVLDSVYSANSSILPKTRIIEYFLVKGYISGTTGNLNEELMHYLSADSIARQLKMPNQKQEYEIYVDQHIANYYLSNEEYEKSLTTLKNLITKYDKNLTVDYQFSRALQVANVGIVFSYLEKPDSSIFYLRKAFDMGLGDYIDLRYQYLILTESYLKIEESDSASKYLELASELFDDSDELSLDNVKFNLVYGDFHASQKELTNANEYYQKALSIAKKMDYINGLVTANEKVLKTSLKLTNNEDLIVYFDAFKSTSDTISRRANLQNEQQLLAQFEAVKKDSKIRELELKNKLELEKSWLLAAILFAIVLIFILFIIAYKKRQKELKQKLKIEQLTKEKVQMELDEKKRELKSKIDTLHQTAKAVENLNKEKKKEEDINDIVKTFDQSYISEQEWDGIIARFESIYENFIDDLKRDVDGLTRNDIKISILLKLNYSNMGMADVLNISPHGVKKAKQRLNKKLKTHNRPL